MRAEFRSCYGVYAVCVMRMYQIALPCFYLQTLDTRHLTPVLKVGDLNKKTDRKTAIRSSSSYLPEY